MRLLVAVFMVGVVVLSVRAAGTAGASRGAHVARRARYGAASPASTHIAVDGRARGRRFDGVGAISGGGGNSRYLIDYPPHARRAILDLLFKPGYGAALQILKVEIGGDADSTDGAEPSIEHRRGRVDCGAGYEWWLMREAKARDPAIKLYALAWAAPGWTRSFWTWRTIRYVIRWMRCARRQGLSIDYLGGNQNERIFRPWWTKALRRALDAAGFAHTRIAVADKFDPRARWAVAEDLRRDRALQRATSVVADHDVCGYPTDGDGCTSTSTARRLGLPLWASELGGVKGNAGAPGMARAIIRGYATARLVGYIAWPLMSAMPPGLTHEEAGLVSAKEPWSGHFEVRAITYAVAMMSWFTAPGWRYVDGASGPLGGDYSNGSYTTLRSARRTAWSTIAETTTAAAEQRVRFSIRGGLAAATVHVWRTRPTASDPNAWMVRRRDVHPVGRRFRYGLRPGYLYSFTTVKRRARSPTASPPHGRLTHYVEPSAKGRLGDEPAYLAAMDGAFQYARCWSGASARCVRQMAPRPPVYWHRHHGFPYAVIGDPNLRDYTVSCDVQLRRRRASAGVIGRFGRRSRAVSYFRGYILDLDGAGRWRLLHNTTSAGVSVLASGTLATPVRRKWHNLALTVHGAGITALVDGKQVAAISGAPAGTAPGIAGIEAGAAAERAGAFTGRSWPVVEYRRLTIAP
jgi:hypothetical protein